MKAEKIEINYKSYKSTSELSEADADLLRRAEEARTNAYAPYSNFHVGAAVRMETGEIIIGTNQENAAYPSGMCAERVALYYAGSQFPNVVIDAIAVSAPSANALPVPPCGSCRQVLLENEQRQIKNIRVLIGQTKGKIIEFDGSESLLPLAFKESFLR